MKNEICNNLVNRQTDRLVWVDTFRAIMIFFIVLGHALAVKPTEDSFLKLYVYSFHVPAFFFVSGYLFRTKEGSFLKFAAHKTKTLMIPYYVFAIASITIFWFLGSIASEKLDVAIKSTDIFANLAGMLYANGNVGYMKWNNPMWFLPCLYVTVLLFYGLEKYIIAKVKKRDLAIVGIFFTFVLADFANFYIFRISKLPFGMETAIYLLPFFIAGYWFKRSERKIQLKKSIKVVICFVALVTGGMLAAYTGHIDCVTGAYRNMILFFASAFSSIIGWVILIKLVPCSKLTYVGKNTLAILVMHKFPVVAMQMIFLGLMGSNIWVGIGVAVLIAVIACLLSLLIGQIIRRIMPWALGSRNTAEK